MTKTHSASLLKFALRVETQALKSFALLEESILANQEALCAWFKAQWDQTPPPLYGSVDLRNAGFKLAPVDMNLFPGGFNNLNPAFLAEAIAAAKETILARLPTAKQLLLIPENHTRNLFYWENIAALVSILEQAGFTVRVGSLNDEHKEPFTLNLESGKTVRLESLVREGGRLKVGDQFPDLLLLNNDLSSGIPQLLQDIEQPLFPPAELGWHQRLKSEHFKHYQSIAFDFAKLLNIDPWLITPLFRYCGEIDFMRSEGLDCLIKNTQAMLQDIQKKYDEYGVAHQPFVIIKADAGTQGMAVMTVRNLDELQALNRKQRTSMAKSKGGIPVNRVLVQEGVYTFETFGPKAEVAEPVIYLWGKRVIGGFYRIHEGRGTDENLNTPGMHFSSLLLP